MVVGGDHPLCSQFPGLLRIVLVKNLTISLGLGFTDHFSWNLNFCHNLSDLEIEDIETHVVSLTFSFLLLVMI